MSTLTIKTNSDKAEATENSVSVIRTARKDQLGRSYGTGRRKNAVARVWVKAGSGKIIINRKNLAEYFLRDAHRMALLQPLDVIGTTDKFDVICTVKGGGLSGQAGAIRHGISRALDQFDPNFHTELKSNGFLTRDPRVVERKKYGQPKARKKKQFSKR